MDADNLIRIARTQCVEDIDAICKFILTWQDPSDIFPFIMVNDSEEEVTGEKTVFHEMLNAYYKEHKGFRGIKVDAFEASLKKMLNLINVVLAEYHLILKRKKALGESVDNDALKGCWNILGFKTKYGVSCAHLLIKCGMWRVVRDMMVDGEKDNVIQALKPTKANNTVFHFLSFMDNVSEEEYVKAVDFLKNKCGCVMTIKNLKHGYSPLAHAIARKNVAYCKVLVQKAPWLVNMRDDSKRAPILQVFYDAEKNGVTEQSREMVKLLIENGADIRTVDKGNKDIYRLASEKPSQLVSLARFTSRVHDLYNSLKIIEYATQHERDCSKRAAAGYDSDIDTGSSQSMYASYSGMPLHVFFTPRWAVTRKQAVTKKELYDELKKIQDEEYQKALSDVDGSSSTQEMPEHPEATEEALIEHSHEIVQRIIKGRFNPVCNEDDMKVEFDLKSNPDNSPVNIVMRHIAMETDPGRRSVFSMHFETTNPSKLPPSVLQMRLAIDEDLEFEPSKATLDCDNSVGDSPPGSTSHVSKMLTSSSVITFDDDDDEKEEEASEQSECNDVDGDSEEFDEEALDKKVPMLVDCYKKLTNERDGIPYVTIEVDWASKLLHRGCYEEIMDSDENQHQTKDGEKMEHICAPLRNADPAELEFHRRRVLCLDEEGRFERIMVPKSVRDRFKIDVMLDVSLSPQKMAIENADARAARLVRKQLTPHVALANAAKAAEIEMEISGSISDETKKNLEGHDPEKILTDMKLKDIIQESLDNVASAIPDSSDKDVAIPTGFFWTFVPRLSVVVAIERR